MIKVFNKGKTMVTIGSICLKPLQEIRVKDHEIEKIKKANSLAKLGLVKITPYIEEKQPEVKTVSEPEIEKVIETKSSKPKTKKKTNKEK